MASRKAKAWRKLDNTALLFLADNGSRDTKVFRFYCELNEDVVPDKLQQALDRTIERYPLFQSHLRRGLFWYYFEESEQKPEVTEEYKDPCAPIYVRDKKQLLFEVTYYKNRINFEVFHALTDGTGATEFLRELVKQYLLAEHAGLADVSLNAEDITVQDMEADGFRKNYSQKKERRVRKPKTAQLKKFVPSQRKLSVTEGTASVKALLAKCHELGVSMTVLLTTVLICAIHREMPKTQEKRPVSLMVPVNLRKFFPSYSMLNFFGWIEPGHKFGDGQDEFTAILAEVKKYFTDNLTQEKMEGHINKYLALEHLPIIRFFPLLIKDIGIRIGAMQTRNDITAVFSNMSAVRMPEEYIPFIHRFGVYTSTPKLELCLCSFEDTISFGFTARYDTTNIERNFFKILDELGIKSEIAEPAYPKSDTPELQGIKVYKVFTFLCILAAVVCLSVNFLFTRGSWWSLVAMAGVGCFWAMLSVGYYKRYNLLKDTMWLYVLLTCGSILWDVAYGFRGWSVDYVFPAISLVVLITMLIITRLQAHPARDYMIYFLMAAGYSLVVSVVLMLTRVVKVIHFSVASSAIGFLVVVLLMLFRWKEFKEEIAKKFHI